ncbi:MAG: hypothetical protein J6S42_00345, partial [Thermoguttaceae bacterium]|nr:hypothetical protein [Thermoguttaceae bacterium]
MRRRDFLKSASLGLACGGPLFAAGDDSAETLLFTGGKIVTCDSAFSLAEAAAIRGNRILAVGALDRVADAAGKGARRIDLDGKTMVPGLIDSHLHPIMAADYEFDHTVPEIET